MFVKKRDGQLEKFNKSKIKKCIERASKNLEGIDVEELTQELCNELYDGISTNDIDNASVLAARSKIFYEPNYSYLASRLQLNIIYKEVFQHSLDGRRHNLDYRNSFIKNMNAMVEAGLLDERCLSKFDLEEISSAIKPEKDYNLKYIGTQTLCDRYLIKHNGKLMETPQAFWMRIAMGLSLDEINPTVIAIQAYELFSDLKYCPGTPTLFNSGTNHSQLSSCFLSTMEDSIDGIFGTLHQQAKLSKYAGGLGIDMTPLRGMGSKVKSTNGKSQGLIPWIKIYNDMLIAVDQGGKRKGAGCIYVEPWHCDILEFLDITKNTGDERRRCHDIHTALWIPDLFIKKVLNNEDWYLFCPSVAKELHEKYCGEFESLYNKYVGENLYVQKINAKLLWKKILTSIFETGHPWITFKDPSNYSYTNSHVGVIHSSNLCTEILLHTKPSIYNESGNIVKTGETAVCNLGSINISAHIEQGRMCWESLEKTVKLAIRLLDNTIDLNFYPTEEAKNSNLKNRPVGLGIFGFQDALYKLNINFESEQQIEFSNSLQEFISYNAISSSNLLAHEKGTYYSYNGSLWDLDILPKDSYETFMKRFRHKTEIKIGEKLSWDSLRKNISEFGMRNSNIMAIAPTATISFICGASQSIEPDFSPIWVYSTLSGEFTMINEYFVERCKNAGIWNRELANLVKNNNGVLSNIDEIPKEIKDVFKRAFDIDYQYIIRGASARQRWIDQGQSLNLYNKTTSMKHLNDMYMKAWDEGLKTTYYLRGLPATQLEQSVKQQCSINADKSNEECESCQ